MRSSAPASRFIAFGRNVGHQYLWIHKATFFLWAALFLIHLLGHLLETPRLAAAGLEGTSRSRHGGVPTPRRRARASVLTVTLAVGFVLGIVSLGWVGTWHHIGRFGRG